MHELIRAHPLGTWTLLGADDLLTHHIPFVLDAAGSVRDARRARRARELGVAVADAPAEYVERMLAAIVGVEIPMERLLGKWKTSQNRPAADRAGVVAGLVRRGDAESAELVARHTTT